MSSVGDLFRLRSWKHYEPKKRGDDGIHTMEFAHPDKRKVAVVVLLGFENKDGTGVRVDPHQALRSIGFVEAKK